MFLILNTKKILDLKRIDRNSNENKANTKSENNRYVIFECALDLNTNWLTHSNGTQYQVRPGLPHQMLEDVAREFEQKGYGKIVKVG